MREDSQQRVPSTTSHTSCLSRDQCKPRLVKLKISVPLPGQYLGNPMLWGELGVPVVLRRRNDRPSLQMPMREIEHYM
jgi:hypothetical protein